MHERRFYIYILTNQTRTVLYIGMTNDLIRRVYEHREHFVEGFTSRYRCDRLVYFEQFATAYDVITREKELKKWRREKKMQLIQRDNQNLEDLYPRLLG